MMKKCAEECRTCERARRAMLVPGGKDAPVRGNQLLQALVRN